MRNVLVVAQRELVEKRNVLLAAFLTGLLPLAMPLLPWVRGGNGADARNVAALMLTSALAAGIATTYGASMIARDLRERRLGFYFARPLSAAALWWGKLAAGVTLITCAVALSLAPTAIAGRGDVLRLLGTQEWAWVPLVILALLLLSHPVAMMVSSRLGWLLAVDLVAFVVVAGTAGALLRRIVLSGAPRMTLAVVSTAAVTVVAALLTAGAVQVASGRADARRSHLALSVTLWSLLGTTTVGIGAYTAFLLSASPSAIRFLAGIGLPTRGSWAVVSGPCRGRGDFTPGFLLDTASSRYVRLGNVRPWGSPNAAISADGSTAAWLDADGDPATAPSQVMVIDLSRPDAKPQKTNVLLPAPQNWNFALSDDGHRLLLGEPQQVSVVDLADGRVVTSARLPLPGNTRFSFASSDRLRITQTDGGPRQREVTRIYRIDLPGGAVVQTGEIKALDALTLVGMAQASSPRVLVRSSRPEVVKLALHDAWTGAELRTIVTVPGRSQLVPAFLDDGRIVVGEAGPGGARVRLVGAEGETIRVYELGLGAYISLGAELSPGLIGIAVNRPDKADSWREAEGLLLDLTTGQTRSLGAGAIPASQWSWHWRQRPIEPGSPVSRLFRTPTGGLAELDPITGKLRQILDTRWFVWE